jgi:FG-GAP-like repeat
MKMTARPRLVSQLALAAVAFGGLAVGARPAHAFDPVTVFQVVSTAVSAAQKFYSAVQWVDCHEANICPPTEVYTQASRVISEVETEIEHLDNNGLQSELQSLLDDSTREYQNQELLTPDEESALVSEAEKVFNDFQVKLNNTTPTIQAQVDSAYITTPEFIVAAALVDNIGRTALARGKVPIDVSWINTKRNTTLATLEAVVGAESIWYQCSSSAMTSFTDAQSFDGTFATRKLWMEFANTPIKKSDTCGNSNNCNVFRHSMTPPQTICQEICTFCFACVGIGDQDIYNQMLPGILAKMTRDPVVSSARSTMERLVKMGALHGTQMLWRQISGEVDLWDTLSDTSVAPISLGAPDPNVWQIVATGDFDGDGFSDILWYDHTDNLMVVWTLKDGVPTSTAAVSGSPPTFMFTAKSGHFVGDLDGDGVSDILWTQTTTDPLLGTRTSFVTWFMQAGTPIPKATSTSAASTDQILGVGNFDGDSLHRADIAYRSTTGAVSIALNGGAKTVVPNVGTVPTTWVVKDVGDFNGDGKSDLLWWNSTSGQLSIWEMSGTTLIANPLPGTVAPSSSWRIQAAVDINHDGISDIAWQTTNANGLFSGPTSIWIMNSNGTLRESTLANMPAGSQFVGAMKQGPAAPSDLPAQPITEAHCGQSSGTLRNPGFGAYETWTSGITFDGGHGTVFGDVTGDGKIDIVTLANNEVDVVQSNGTSFTRPLLFWPNAFYGSHGTLIGDFDGDGYADLVGLGDGYIGYLHFTNDVIKSDNTRGAFGPYQNLLSASFFGSHGTLFADIDGDGKADLVALNDANVTVRRSNTTALLPVETGWASPFYGTGSNTFLGDVDGDGKADLVGVGNGYVGVILSVASPGSTGPLFGTYQTWRSTNFAGTHGVFLADVDGDGRKDLVGLNDASVTVARSTGTTFGPDEIWWSGGPFYGNHGSFVGDVDENSRADLIGIGDGYIGVVRSQ